MKRNIAEYVAQCSNCQQVKPEHKRPGGLAQTMDIPIWKWEAINMDFITCLPFSFNRHDSIWVITDRLTKATHFLPVKSSNTTEEYAKLYVREVVRVNLSTAFHPQTDGQDEHTIQTLKDMLRACVLDFKGETQILGPDLVHEAIEKVKLIKERLKMAQSRQKSYAAIRRRDIEFQVDDGVFLKVSPMKGVMRFRRKGKFSPDILGHIKLYVELPSMGFSEHLSYEEVPVAILDRLVRKFRTKDVASVKVLWRS
ncbi:hypothetical protein MTR67_002704 [Solanum verrucosum]|uniref:Uncharacterized protein n=1 Tax=Solanum verrucosum TaxID=315347 RepID=A0AAF0PWP5_SOLVR|nr:hypothetical protein MTR67_002704 [Solanum verrucosum]